LINQKGEEVWGPFTLEARKAILRRLLETEKQVGYQLISIDELLLIQKLWQQGNRSCDGAQADTSFSVARIMYEVKGEITMPSLSELLSNGEQEDELLTQICERYQVRPDVIERLRAAEEKVAHLQRRDAIFNDIDEILDQPSAGRPH
jgi:DNA sulfur modification protein DndC